VECKERLEHETDQVTPVQCELFNKLFQHHERQLLQEVGTRATGPRSTFTTQLVQLKTAEQHEVYGAANMTADKCVECQVRLSNAENEATTGSIADTDLAANLLEREIHGITLNEPMQLKK